MAFIAALPAAILVYQKLINRYEHNPTPSQPINNCRKLLAVININMKKVNKDKYAKNLGSCGSSDIYDVEYICTIQETIVTTINIVTDKLSNKKIQSSTKNSFENHENNEIVITLCFNATVQNNFKASIVVKTMLIKLTNMAPIRPILYPNKMQNKLENKGSKITNNVIRKIIKYDRY